MPTLADLLKSPAERPPSFKIGVAYDIEDVGLAKRQGAFSSEYRTTDCADEISGVSRCGHYWGTKLTPEQKRALLEYLKSP